MMYAYGHCKFYQYYSYGLCNEFENRKDLYTKSELKSKTKCIEGVSINELVLIRSRSIFDYIDYVCPLHYNVFCTNYQPHDWCCFCCKKEALKKIGVRAASILKIRGRNVPILGYICSECRASYEKYLKTKNLFVIATKDSSIWEVDETTDNSNKANQNDGTAPNNSATVTASSTDNNDETSEQRTQTSTASLQLNNTPSQGSPEKEHENNPTPDNGKDEIDEFIKFELCKNGDLKPNLIIEISPETTVLQLKSIIILKLKFNCQAEDISIKYLASNSGKTWITIDDKLNEKSLTIIFSKGNYKITYEFHDDYQKINFGNASKENSQLSSMKVLRPFCGLENLGNTCYMNSGLQCLNHISELLLSLAELSADHSTYSELTRSYVNLANGICSHDNTALCPCELRSAFGNVAPRFAHYRQQDSMEFINILLETIHEDLIQNKPNHTSIIQELFHGELGSQVQCLNGCEKPLTTFDSFCFLPLPICEGSRDAYNLDECFQLFCKTENIGKYGKWYCNECKKLTNAEKSISFRELPKILIIQLKRFNYDLRSYLKIDTTIKYPLEGLDLRKYVSDQDQYKNVRYELVAVSNHYGSLLCGHYTTYGKNTENNQWYSYDDKWVDKIDKSRVESNKDAYVLIYRQKPETHSISV